jgi:hypothetical protein
MLGAGEDQKGTKMRQVAVFHLTEVASDDDVRQLAAYFGIAQNAVKVYRYELDLVVTFEPNPDYPPARWLEDNLSHVPWKRVLERGALLPQVWPIE